MSGKPLRSTISMTEEVTGKPCTFLLIHVHPFAFLNNLTSFSFRFLVQM